METYSILKDLAIILVFAKSFGILARKCKAPMVVGEIIAGLVLGPVMANFGFALVKQNDFLSYMSEIGVILIMFSAGLETNLEELKKSGFQALMIACMGVLIPLVGGTLLYMGFYGYDGLGTENFFKAIFIGCIMTATSVGITVETLKELGYLKGSVGQTILSAAIIDDVIGIVVLTFVIGFKDPSTKPVSVLIYTVLFFVLAVLGGVLIFKIFKRLDARYPHSRRIPIIGFAICFALAYLAEEYFGIADITGAYVAGIILCNCKDADYIDRKVSVTNYMIFGPIFFVCIGLKTDLSAMNLGLLWFSLAFVAVALLTKIIGCGLCAKVFGHKFMECMKIGVGMMTRGEVALIITQKGMNLGIIDSSYFSAVILLIITSSISVPILLKLLYAKSPDAEVLAAEKANA